MPLASPTNVSTFFSLSFVAEYYIPARASAFAVLNDALEFSW